MSIRQSAFDCPFAGTLRVDQLAYADDFRPIASLTATADGVCRTDEGDSPRVVLELRVHSARPLVAVAFSPVDAGRVTVGEQSEPKAVTIRNTGTTQVELGQPSVAGATSGDWTIQANHCPAALAVGVTCTVDVVATAVCGRTHSAQLEMTDSTTRGRHHAALTVTGLGVAGLPKNFNAIGTLTGVDLSWDLPIDNGGSEVTGYTVHRLVDGIDDDLPWRSGSRRKRHRAGRTPIRRPVRRTPSPPGTRSATVNRPRHRRRGGPRIACL